MTIEEPPSSPLKDALRAIVALERKLEHLKSSATEPIAIIGMGCRFPGGADNPTRFWQLLRSGMDAVGPIPEERVQTWLAYDANLEGSLRPGLMRGGWLSDLEQFDPYFFGMSPREAQELDPQQRLLLEVTWQTLEDAGLPREHVSGSDTGVYVGILSSDHAFLQLARPDHLDAHSATGMAHSTAVGRVSYFLDLHGPSIALDAACSSSLVAVHQAVTSLRAGHCEMALAGGVNVISHPLNTILINRLQALSPDGVCRAFDAKANGYVRGEGCGMLLLKRLSKALADGDRIRAVIRGIAANHDGRSNGLTAPNGLAQAACARKALAEAQLSPAVIGFVETHGTGTRLGDPIEAEALKEVYGEPRHNELPLILGALKSNIGHLEAAAGVAALIKTVLALEAKEIPPNRNFDSLNPEIDLSGTPLAIASELRAWPDIDGNRYAGVSGIGLNGSNCHLVLQSAPARQAERAPQVTATDPLLLTISAHDRSALVSLTRAYREKLALEDADMIDVCYSCALHRTHFDHRTTLVVRSQQEAVQLLDQSLAKTPSELGYSGRASKPRPQLLFVLAGQGAAFWPLPEWLLRQPPFRDSLEACDAIARPLSGASILTHVTSRTGELTPSIIQPAFVALQIALASLWEANGVLPDAVIGHSLGEVSAAYLAGALSLKDAMTVAYHRGRLIETTCGQGRMAFVAMSPESAEPLLARYRGALCIAAENGPDSIVLSGTPAAIEGARVELEERDIYCRVLESVTFASHSHEMEQACTVLTEVLSPIVPRPPRIPFYSTTYDRQLEGAETGSKYWGNNVRLPVRFHSAVNRALEAGAQLFLEIGPHPVLSPALKQIIGNSGHTGVVLASLHREREPPLSLKEGLAVLHNAGYPIDWRKQFPENARYVPLPLYCWNRERFWFEASMQSYRDHEANQDGPPVVRLSELQSLDSAQKRVRLHAYLQAQISHLLRMPADRLDERQPLRALGFDSLMAVELKNRTRRDLAVDLSIARMLSGISLVQLLEAVQERLKLEIVNRDAERTHPAHHAEPAERPRLPTSSASRLPHLDGRARSPLEAVILKSFADVLGIAIPKVSDDFLQLGGDAQTAAAAAKDISAICEVSLTGEDIIACRTAAALNSFMQPKISEGKPAGGRGVDGWLVTLKAAEPPAGRLICFPHLGGGASMYAPLARQLKLGAVEIHGVQLPGREERLAIDPFFSFEAMLDALLPALVSYLNVPFVLFGHSMGGLVAFEVARALRRLGLPEPKHLVVSAIAAPTKVESHHFLHTLDENGLRSLLHTGGVALAEHEVAHFVLPTFRADAHLLRSYRYRPAAPLDMPVTVLSGRSDPLFHSSDLDDWRTQTTNACALEFLKGGHSYLVDDPSEALHVLERVLLNAFVLGEAQ